MFDLNICIGNMPIKLKNARINIIRCAEERCLSRKKIAKDRRNTYSLHFITYGKGKIIYGENKDVKTLGMYDTFMVFKDYDISYYPNEKQPWSYIWIQFEAENFEAVLETCGITRQTPYMHLQEFEKIYPLLNALLESYDCTDIQDFQCYGYFLIVLSQMMRMKQTNIDNSKRKQKLRNAMIFIQTNYNLHITVADIAGNSCLSSSYLLSLFSNYLHCSPIEYQHYCRIATACEIFQKDKNITVGKTANEVGYQDQLYFSRVFKKIKGMSPLKYRKVVQTENPREIIPHL